MRTVSGFNFGTGAPPNVITNGLVLWLDAANRISYPESGVTWGDLTSQGNDGTLTNGPTYSTNNGGIIDFDGADDCTDLGNPSPSSLNTQYATTELWIKLDSPNNGIGQQLLARRNTSDGTFTMAKSTANRLVFNTRNSSNTVISLTLNTLPSTNWVQLAHTYNGTTISAYVNGVLDNSSTALSGPLNTGGSFYFQIARNTTGAGYCDCKIGVVRVYNRALSAGEVLRNFTAMRGRYGI